MTPEKAEILGLLCAEGSHYKYTSTYKEFFKNRGINGKYYQRTKNLELVEFTNLDNGLLQHFRNLMLQVYNYAPRPTGVKTSLKIRIVKKDVIKDLVGYTDFGCTKWGVPYEIEKSENNIKSSFIRGFFDGDGCVTNHDLRIKSVNNKGIYIFAQLLISLGIKCKVFGPYKERENWKDYYTLVMPKSEVFKYITLINSNHNKKRKLLAMLGTNSAGILDYQEPKADR